MGGSGPLNGHADRHLLHVQSQKEIFMSDILACFVHMSDTHLSSDSSYNAPYASYPPQVGMDALIKAMAALPFRPDFVLHTGDVVYDPYLSVYAYARDELAKFGLPVYYVCGNHDSSEGIQRILMGRDEVMSKLHYTFEFNGIQFIVIDSNDTSRVTVPAGYVSEDQLEWLESLCTADDPRPLVVATHHNVLPSGVPWLDGYMRTANGEDLHRVLAKARHRLRGVFHGHIHQAIDQFRDGVLYSAAASPWCQFGAYPIPENTQITEDRVSLPGFSVVTVTNDSTYIRRHTFTV
jgi:Icc protein